jgi:hypothetical protein
MWPFFSQKRNPKANPYLTWTNILTSGFLLYGFGSNMPSLGLSVIALLKIRLGVGNLALRRLSLRLVAVSIISG